MIEIQIDITDLEDLKSANNTVVMNSIAASASAALGVGGRVVLKRTYCNAPDDMLLTYTAADVFEKDWIGLFEQK